MINQTETGILKKNFVDRFFIGFTTSCARFSVFYAGNGILFQIKVNARNIKETILAAYFIKVTARPSFLQRAKAFFNINFKNNTKLKKIILSSENNTKLKKIILS